jgi:preprotein translocase subunit YajC
MFANLILFANDDKAPTPEGGLFGGLGPILPMILIFGAFYFLIIMPMKRREKKERENLLTNLKKNDEVVTFSGLIGIVAMVKDNDEVVLKVDESSNVRLRVLKSSIARITTPKEPGKETTPAASAQAAAQADNVKAGNPPGR